MQLTAYKLRLERHAVDPYELFRGRSPRRQDNVTRWGVLDTEPVAWAVYQHLRQKEKFRDQLLSKKMVTDVTGF